MNCLNCNKTLREGAAFCDSCGASVSVSAEVTTLSLDAQAERPKDPLIGRLIDGKYELVALLGSGGMGSVYLARRVHIGDQVAVKVLHGEFVDEPNAVERFRREAKAAAMLHHPAVVAIYDFGEARGTDPAFIVMELVEGQTLREHLETEGAIKPGRAVALMNEVCKGVAVAHKLNIVHRDIKPDNIMILPPDDDGHERVKVVDFGIAKLKDMVAAKTLTQSGRMIGTVYYMSPEQCAAEHLDARADVYSLGAVLYELLTGAPPFTAETASGVIAKHLTQPPPPLPAEFGVSPKIEAVIVRSLAKEPEGRPADAAALRMELLAAVGEPLPRKTLESIPAPTTAEVLPATPLSLPTTVSGEVTAKAPATPYTKSSSSRGRWIAFGLVAIIVIAAAGVVARRIWLRPKPPSAPPAAVMNSTTWQVNHTLETKSRVYALAFSPDDQLLVSASSEGLREDRDFISELHFWRVGNGVLERTITEHSEGMLSLAFSPDGKLLATGLGSGSANGRIGKIKLWDAQTGTLKWAVNGHSDFVTSVVFSPDGKTIASGSFDKTVKLWDVESGQLRISLPQERKVYAIAFAPSGNLIAVASQNGVELRSIDSNEMKLSLAKEEFAFTAVTFSRDGGLVAASDVSGKVTLWDGHTGAVRSVMTDHTDLVDALAFSPDGKTLATGGYDANVMLWDVESGSVLTKLSDSDKITGIAFSHDGQTLASAGWAKAVRLWRK